MSVDQLPLGGGVKAVTLIFLGLYMNNQAFNFNQYLILYISVPPDPAQC